MFSDDTLQEHLETSPSIQVNSVVIAEWNMNLADNIAKIGNYRYRPSAVLTPGADGYNQTDALYKPISSSYDPQDAEKQVKFYTGATDADVVIDGGISDDGVPMTFISKKEKEKLLYSLEDCFNRFRPRSGINKLRYFVGKHTHYDNENMASRPRYYMAHKDDMFKYWTSYRTEDGIERGISKNVNGKFVIDDAAPFVVYKKPVAANRVIVKMQTHVGTVNIEGYSNSYSSFSDPFYGEANKATPTRWKVQYLNNNTWNDAISFDEFSVRPDGSPIIAEDGYVELSYGLVIPEKYKNTFVIAGEFSDTRSLPTTTLIGNAYLVKESDTDLGNYYVWDGYGYEVITPSYTWTLSDENIVVSTNFVTDPTNPESFINPVNGQKTYREFQYISGLRIVVDTMNKEDCPFELIELSPRLAMDISDRTKNFTISKTASDLGVSGMPVGQLIASTGNISIFDFDDAFNPNNVNSIISDHVSKNIQLRFYEAIHDVGGKDFYVPIKTLYADGFPETSAENREVTIPLRDMYFYFESITAPQIIVQNVSVSYAVSLLLDSIGFTNYQFKRVAGESEMIIPNFYIAPDRSVAEVLQDIAVSTQTAMFFDEFNNFVMLSKNYSMPKESERATDVTLLGSPDSVDSGVVENATITTNGKKKLANIVAISSTENNVFNDGVIRYTNRHIQKTYRSVRQSGLIDKDKNWVYKPVLLWEVSGTENVRSRNDEAATQSSYALSAVPLNSDLSSDVPTVVNGVIVNNTIDLGDGIYWVARYNGYFFANGEVIKYDAVEYNVSGIGNVWIKNNQEYQNYFSKVPFNGKIYPTGVVRIFAEPNYESNSGVTKLQNGAVAKHGRGQFGTSIVTHNAGLSAHWSDTNPATAPVRGCNMQSKYLFSGDLDFSIYGAFSSYSSNTLNAPADLIIVDDSSRVSIGSYVELKTTAGRLSNNTRVTSIATGKTAIVSSGTATGDEVLFTTSSNHGFSFGDYVSITGMSPTSFNVTTAQILEITSPTTFKVFAESDYGTIITGSTTHAGSAQTHDRLTISPAAEVAIAKQAIDRETFQPIVTELRFVDKVTTTTGKAGYSLSNNALSRKATRNGVIRNFLANSSLNETDINNFQSTQAGTIQSSALVLNGPSFDLTQEPLDFLSYVYKPLDNRFTHFGTRLRVVGRIDTAEDKQTPYGSMTYYTGVTGTTDSDISIAGGSGGIAMFVDPETNNGYYLEVITLTENNLSNYSSDGNLHNFIFYKVARDASSSSVADNTKAIPVKLWGGTSQFIVDDGKFTGQYRTAGEEKPSVYDISVEYIDVGTTRKFYIYLNNKVAAVVEDTSPIPIKPENNNMALFVRGTSRLMFENIYAMGTNYSQNTVAKLDTPFSGVFGDSEVTNSEAFRKYAMSGMVQSQYLSGISSSEPPRYNMYFEEFGTIMREAAHMNVKYDKAYPALYAKISPTFNSIKGYTISGFMAGAYGAEFMIFNNTDTVLNLDETSGNYLRIQGVTFTQQSQHDLTVDEYFSKNSDFSKIEFGDDATISSIGRVKEDYKDIKNSRLTYGKKEFSLDSPYIQDYDSAQDLMSWMISKIMKPRKSVGMKVFGMSTIQLGDIVEIVYKDKMNTDQISLDGSRFIVYNIEYSGTQQGPEMTVYVSEVV